MVWQHTEGLDESLIEEGDAIDADGTHGELGVHGSADLASHGHVQLTLDGLGDNSGNHDASSRDAEDQSPPDIGKLGSQHPAGVTAIVVASHLTSVSR
jgi:hypothetical protein